MSRRFFHKVVIVAGALGLAGLFGCGHNPPPAPMAPPLSQAAPMNAPMNQAMGGAPTGQVYTWQDVPVGQQVPIMRAVFDQGGYQLYMTTGETIVVPFANQSLYVMKFGRSNNGQTYFVNEGNAPTLYLGNGAYLENAVAQGARWYPIPQDYAYSRPMYVALAPTWGEYTAMGWYPGMVSYGGMWGYSPYASFHWMPGFYINIGGRRYSDYVSYRTYYTSNPGYVQNRVVYNNYGTRATGSFRSSSSYGHTGSFGRSSGSFGSSGGFGRSGRSSGSFGFNGGAAGSTGSFGSGSRSGGFGSSGASSGGSFGTGGRTAGSGAFGSGSGGSFGARDSGSSFGSGGGSFGGSGRSSGSSFGSVGSGGSSSFGRSGGSFGGGGFGSRRSGGSFGGGGGRRR